ncbi:MAG: hypothetical protein JWO70_2277 [Betaproteobacteria bacterium]|nr:hypothetical protein [Betaproteobacteria bacterium]
MAFLAARLPGLALAVCASFAAAQTYPAKPVRFVAPYPAGGVNDVVARVLAERLTQSLGQQWLVENRPGRGGNIGTDFAAKAAPDGYTLLHGGMGSLTLGPFLGKVPYDTMRDFAAVTLTARAPNVIAVHPSLPVKSLKELIALAKAQPGTLNYATSGIGSTPHLTAALFESMARVRMTHIPYKGGPPATVDVIAGQVPVGFMPISTLLPHIRAGRLRALGVSGTRRSPTLPEVPTVGEAALAGFEMNPWFGVLAPAAVPREIVTKLNAELVRLLRVPEVGALLASQGVEAAYSSPEEFAAVIRSDLRTWPKVIREAGIRGE